MTDAAEAMLNPVEQEMTRLRLALMTANQHIVFNRTEYQMRLQIRDERIESDGHTIRHLTKENVALTALNESYAAMLGFAHIPRFAS